MKDYFDTYKVQPSYKDVDTLKRYLTSRGKIVGIDKSKLSAKNQRKLAEQIKHARYLGLIAYTSYQKENRDQSEEDSS